MDGWVWRWGVDVDGVGRGGCGVAWEEVEEKMKMLGKSEGGWGGRRGRGMLCWMGWDVMGVKCGREGRVAASGWGGVGER